MWASSISKWKQVVDEEDETNWTYLYAILAYYYYLLNRLDFLLSGNFSRWPVLNEDKIASSCCCYSSPLTGKCLTHSNILFFFQRELNNNLYRYVKMYMKIIDESNTWWIWKKQQHQCDLSNRIFSLFRCACVCV